MVISHGSGGWESETGVPIQLSFGKGLSFWFADGGLLAVLSHDTEGNHS